MKIFTSTQIKELDKYTIENEPVTSIALMERAAKALTDSIKDRWNNDTHVIVFAGPGNNGGDALAVARMLAEYDYHVEVFLFNVHNHLSDDCEINKQRLIEGNKTKKFTEITLNLDLPKLTADTLIIDGLFGSGISKPLTGGFAIMVKYINQSPAKVVSIDIPSGLMCEDNTFNEKENIIKADLTLTLQQKKLSMLFDDNQEFIGELKVLDINLSQEYINNTESTFNIITEDDIRPLLHQRGDFVNKGDMGNAFIIAGSYGMSGAAILASRSCLRSGVGKVTVHTPKSNYDIMQISVPEAVLQIDKEGTCFTEAVDASSFDAVCIGPGIGKQEITANALFSQIRRTTCPLLLDADAINLVSTHRSWLQQLPTGMILTPHPREFDRLSGEESNGCYERLHKAQDTAQHLGCYIILKGHYSALCLPDGNVIFNSTGNSGMATAGSGDVLSGIITAFLAKGYSQKDACLLGMYIHGRAGDLAAKELGKESLIASDIIKYLPQAFNSLGNI
nr:NAD(P)H-hydrate dehydratase [Prevotella sp.]